MKNFILSVASITALMTGMAWAAESNLAAPVKTASFKTAGGQDGGNATFTSTKAGILIRLDLKNITPGWHAMHFHEKGDCSPPDSFENAGGHFNPHGHDHGFDHADHHAGDMPNIKIGENGRAELEVLNDHVSLAGGEESLIDADGSSLIIHTADDDYKSQPSGNAGKREACAVIAAK